MQPVPKVIGATVAGAVTTLVVYALGLAGLAIPSEVAAALTTVFAFVGGYMTSNS